VGSQFKSGQVQTGSTPVILSKKTIGDNMIKKFENATEFFDFMNNLPKGEFILDEEDTPLFYLDDGVFFSIKKPKILDQNKEFEFDTDKDFISIPYETDIIFIWRGEKPTRIENIEGQANYGASLSIFVGKPGYITVCYEND
jgi:hypothetical protein